MERERRLTWILEKAVYLFVSSVFDIPSFETHTSGGMKISSLLVLGANFSGSYHGVQLYICCSK